MRKPPHNMDRPTMKTKVVRGKKLKRPARKQRLRSGGRKGRVITR